MVTDSRSEMLEARITPPIPASRMPVQCSNPIRPRNDQQQMLAQLPNAYASPVPLTGASYEHGLAGSVGNPPMRCPRAPPHKPDPESHIHTQYTYHPEILCVVLRFLFPHPQILCVALNRFFNVCV